MKPKYIIFMLAVLLAGCAKEAPQPQSLIMEGWIDAGGHPVVLIHRSYVLATAPDSVMTLEEVMTEQLIPFGKVVVSDGEQEEILTGRLDTTYMPPYTYSTINMDGEVGKTYTVTVDYKDFHAKASGTILPVAYLDSLTVKTDSAMADVHCFMSGVDSSIESYYALFIRHHDRRQFRLCPLAVFRGQDAVDGNMDIIVTNPYKDTLHMVQSLFFPRDSMKYQLKLARIDYPAYEFWKAYDAQVVTGGIMFVPIYKNMPSNVEGGIGFFTAMGSSTYNFQVVNDTVYHFSHP